MSSNPIKKKIRNLNSVIHFISFIFLLLALTATGFNVPDYTVKRTPLITISGIVKYTDSAIVSAGTVKALWLDTANFQIVVRDSTGILTNGSYFLPNVPQSGPVFIMAYPSSEDAFIPTYHQSTVSWQNALLVNTDSSSSGIDVFANRIQYLPNQSFIYGYINGNQVSPSVFLKDAIIYARAGGIYKGFAVSMQNGYYKIPSLPQGNYTLYADRIGYIGQTITSNLNSDSIRVDFNLIRLPIGIKNLSKGVPKEYVLEQNYPNPFNPETKIRFSISKSGLVKLTVYNILGKEITSLVNQYLNPGTYEVVFNSNNIPSGVYFYIMESGSYISARKMILIK
jgi:Secretion system C-terminal sorting domain